MGPDPIRLHAQRPYRINPAKRIEKTVDPMAALLARGLGHKAGRRNGPPGKRRSHDGFVSISADGHTWLFTFDYSTRSLCALFDVLNAYERDPESGFSRWHSDQILRALAHQLLERAESRRTAAI